MPSYTYFCQSCDESFDLFATISQYKEIVKCPKCKQQCSRNYDDMLTLNSSVKKSDSELKTLGDLANRNRDRMSDDHKAALNKKHNDYKQTSQKELPKGMTRMKKPSQKIQWPK